MARYLGHIVCYITGPYTNACMNRQRTETRRARLRLQCLFLTFSFTIVINIPLPFAGATEMDF